MAKPIHADDKSNGAAAEKKTPLPPHYSVHKSPHISMLSSDYTEVVNFRGLVNCMTLFLIISNLPRMFRNFQDYGAIVLRFTLAVVSFQESSADLFLGTWFVILGFIGAAYVIGRLEISFPTLDPITWDFLHVINTVGSLILPTWMLFKCSGLYVLSLGTAGGIVIVHMKLWSFGHFCSAVRSPQAEKDDNDKEVRHRLVFSHYLYFMMAPTMCYQSTYPRDSGPIRKRFVARRAAEAIFCSLLILFIFGQYVTPFLPTSKDDRLFDGSDPVWMIITVFRVSVPLTCVWLLMFYGFFHSFLNLLSEVLRFSDRQFYKDWWNSTDIAEYWRKWNMPVHHWAFRHIYRPLRRRNFPGAVAGLVVFFYSAVLHELVVDAALHFIPSFPHGFVAMMGQIPLISITQAVAESKYIKTGWNNLVFWLAFCVFGQPLAILLYAQDFSRFHAVVM